MLTFEMRKDIECTDEERHACLAVIRDIVKMAEKTRSQGLLALEDYIAASDDYLIKKGIGLLVDGQHMEFVKQSLSNLIISSHKKGAELLKQLIIMDGLLLIQAGNNPRIIDDYLRCYLGMDFLAGLEDDKRSEAVHMERRWDNMVDELSELSMAFCMTVESMNGFTLQRILHAANSFHLPLAFRAMTAEARKKVLENMSKNAQVIFLEDYENYTHARSRDIEEAQREIMKTAISLEDQGEIIIGENTWRQIINAPQDSSNN